MIRVLALALLGPALGYSGKGRWSHSPAVEPARRDETGGAGDATSSSTSIVTDISPTGETTAIATLVIPATSDSEKSEQTRTETTITLVDLVTVVSTSYNSPLATTSAVEIAATPDIELPWLEGFGDGYTYAEASYTFTSTPTKTSTTSTPSSTPTSKKAPPSSSAAPQKPSCTCGYRLTKYDNTWFPHHHKTVFSDLKVGDSTAADVLKKNGWIVGDGHQLGLTYQGVEAKARADTVTLKDGVLELTCPGGQGDTKFLAGAEVYFDQDFISGVFSVEAKMSLERGSVQRFYTYRVDPTVDDRGPATYDLQQYFGNGDTLLENDGELQVHGAHLWVDSPTELDPHYPGQNIPVGDAAVIQFPTDPTADYHTHTIERLKDSVGYYFDGNRYDFTPEYVASHQSRFHIDNWSNTNPRLSMGPPEKDVVLSVKSIDMYYRQDGEDLPNGCDDADICKI